MKNEAVIVEFPQSESAKALAQTRRARNAQENIEIALTDMMGMLWDMMDGYDMQSEGHLSNAAVNLIEHLTRLLQELEAVNLAFEKWHEAHGYQPKK